MSTDQDIAFPKLSEAQIQALMPRGKVRRVAAGEVLWTEGDRGFNFFVILDGEMEIIDPTGDEPRPARPRTCSARSTRILNPSASAC
jgi:CRP-like cAMP-binding protein